MPTTLLLIDNQEIYCRGLRSALADSQFRVADEFRSYDDICAVVKSRKPGMVLLGMPSGGQAAFFQAIKSLRRQFSSLPIVAMLTSENPAELHRVLESGANHYFLKSVSTARLLQILHDVYHGRDEEIQNVWAKLTQHRHPEIGGDPLTWREMEVLRLMTLGLSNKKIASDLGISSETAKEHVQNIIRKLGVENRTQAAVLAVRKGWGTE